MMRQETRRKLGLGLGLVGVASLAFCCGRYGAAPRAAAAPPDEAPTPDPVTTAKPEGGNDYSTRVVAYIYGNIPVTRRDLGEYLIARQGAEKLEYLVNKLIIEHEAKKKGVEVTVAEVDAALAEDLKGMGNLPLRDFEDKVLKQYKKTLFEWKEDVIKPKLLMTKLCRDRVTATPEDLQHAFEAHYGEKVEGRIILFPPGEEKTAMKLYAEIRESEENFNRYARQQASPSLASTGGKIRAVSRFSTGNAELEREVMTLQPGEVSKIVGTPEGSVIFKCDQRHPPEDGKTLESERVSLEKEVLEKKLHKEMPEFFTQMKKDATPKLFLQQYKTEDDWKKDIEQLIQTDPIKPAPGQMPNAN